MNLSYWQVVVEKYTKCQLTVVSDRLIALSGIAQEVHHMLNTNYLAGMWHDHLSHMLLWKPVADDTAESPRYIAPSWSWASTGRAVSFPDCASGLEQDSFRTCVSILGTQVTLANLHDPYGQVTDGHITLRGRLGLFYCVGTRPRVTYLGTSVRLCEPTICIDDQDSVSQRNSATTDHDIYAQIRLNTGAKYF
jgi:hypothetical protein